MSALVVYRRLSVKRLALEGSCKRRSFCCVVRKSKKESGFCISECLRYRSEAVRGSIPGVCNVGGSGLFYSSLFPELYLVEDGHFELHYTEDLDMDTGLVLRERDWESWIDTP